MYSLASERRKFTVVVSFTANIGLAKPDDSELALNWARSTELQKDNNTLIKSNTNKPLVSYTPVLTAHTTPPNMGTGFSQGEYQDWMGFVTGTFTLEFFDAGIAVGSGEYGISLPFPADGVYHSVGTALNATPGNFSVIGEAYFMDNSSVGASGSGALDIVTVGGVSYVRILTELHTTPVKTSRIFRDSMPFAVANNDKIVGTFFYKKA